MNNKHDDDEAEEEDDYVYDKKHSEEPAIALPVTRGRSARNVIKEEEGEKWKKKNGDLEWIISSAELSESEMKTSNTESYDWSCKKLKANSSQKKTVQHYAPTPANWF